MRKLMLAVVGVLAAGTTLAADMTTTGTIEDHLTSSAQAKWRHENLGTQISAVTVMGGAFGPGPDGRPVAYFCLMGQPGQLAVVDAESGRTLRVLPLPGADGSYDAVVSSAGPVYLPSHPNGNLYRYTPGTDQVENLGKPAEHVTFIWEVVEGPGGKIYGACYPESTLFEYDPATSKFRNLGSVKEGEDYARSLYYHPERKKLYVGVGSHAALMEIDPVTGEKRDILPEEYRKEHFVYSLGCTGDRLIARLDPSNKGVVLNLESGKVEDVLPVFGSNSSSEPASPGGSVYYSGEGNGLTAYVPGKGAQPVKENVTNSSARGFYWTSSEDEKSSTLLALMINSKIARYSPTEDRTEIVQTKLPRQPVHIQSITLGPDSKIYSSGYVLGNIGVHDPETGEHHEFSGVKQSEGFTNYESRIYCGTYPRARITVLDTAKPVDKENPKQLFTLEDYGQDRPFGMLGVPEEQKVFIGTVPSYGLLGGVLAIYDPVTSDLQVHRDLMPNQGIVTFVYKDGILYGGTTIHGGLGIEPTEKDAKLFLWDVKKGEKVFETVPVPGGQGISGLRIGPDGNVWGWAQGTLFVFDPKERKVVYSDEKFTSDAPPRHFWRGGPMLELAEDGFYGMVDGRLYHLEPATKEVEILAQGKSLELLARDRSGRLYYIEKDKLHRLTPVGKSK